MKNVLLPFCIQVRFIEMDTRRIHCDAVYHPEKRFGYKA